MTAEPVEIRRNDDGSIDEVIVKGATVCIEQMYDDLWTMGASTSGGRTWLFQFTREGKAIVLKCVDADA